MEIEIFTLCDFAQDSNGKLTIVGTFDTINMPQMPAQVNACYIAARIRFYSDEKGKIPLGLRITTDDGVNVIPALEGELQIPHAHGVESITQNICIGLNGLQINDYGKYYLTLFLKGEEMKTLPLYIVQTKVN